MKSFDTHFKNFTRGIEDHEFRHFNNSLGCMIYSKEHYYHELKSRGMVPFEMAEEQCEQYTKKNSTRKYELSDKARRIINCLKLSAKNGMIKMSEHPKAVAALKELGLDLERQLDNSFINN